MDDFREWLSDNLRYFMLGGAILLVVLVLFFSVRACTGGKDEAEPQGTESNQETDASQTDKSDSDNSAQSEDENPLVEASAEIKELTQEYYTALGSKDVTKLETFVENLSPAEEAKITNARYIESYELGDVFTKNGMTDGSYVVYASYTYRCTGIETAAPGMSWLYVVTDSEGNLKIDGSAPENTEISAYAKKLEESTDVAELAAKVDAELEAAKQSDPDLAEFLSGLGEDADGSAAAENGTILTANDNSNVRAAADGEADIIGGISAGTEVEKLGEEGEWIQIDYEGQTGYVHNSLLDEQ